MKGHSIVKSRKLIAPALAAVTLLALAACQTRPSARIDVGSYAFVSGEFMGRIDARLDVARGAVEQALRESGWQHLAVQAGQGSILVRADEPRDDGAEAARRIEVRLRNEPKSVRVTIAIGTVGDERRSAELFQRIAALAAEAPPASTGSPAPAK